MTLYDAGTREIFWFHCSKVVRIPFLAVVALNVFAHKSFHTTFMNHKDHKNILNLAQRYGATDENHNGYQRHQHHQNTRMLPAAFFSRVVQF